MRKKAKREELREKGQFWTPVWVAKAMVEYVSQKHNKILDLGIGKGAFLKALKAIKGNKFKSYLYYGIDIDSELIDKLKREKAYKSKKHTLEVRDFIFMPPQGKFEAIISNPPYIRHHRLSQKIKNRLKQISLLHTGKIIDGRAGMHIYFLIQALGILEKGGRLAFIMPADTCEGVFANHLWDWITKNYCLEGIVSFTPEATPFPDIDTNALIFFISNKKQKDEILKIKCTKPNNTDLYNYVKLGFNKPRSSLVTGKVELKKALKLGLSRDIDGYKEEKYKLQDFAKVLRGIATGANGYFLMTTKQKESSKIPNKFFVKCIGRTRDIEGSKITQGTLMELDKKGRPSYLLYLDGMKIDDLPGAVQKYLEKGEKERINRRALISTRNPWYKMEKRDAPEYLFAYLGRRNSRFIRNKAKVLPLTSFLCVYPLIKNKKFVEKLWKVLSHKDTLKNLVYIGKSYGSGAIKVEPRRLEQLSIPFHLLKKFSLNPVIQKLI